MKLIIIQIFVIILLHLKPSESLKILYFCPAPSKSSVVIAQQLAIGLAESNHDVTLVSPFALGREVRNLRDVSIPVRHLTNHKEITQGATQSDKMANPLQVFPKLINMSLTATELIFNHENFQNIYKNEKFDVLLVCYMFNMASLGLSSHFQCPSVVVTPVGVMKDFASVVGQPTNAEAVPHMFFDANARMSFIQRFLNHLANIAEFLMSQYATYKNQQLYNKMFPTENFPSYDEVRNNVSLVLVSSHFSQGRVRPLLPNVIEVGGLQIKETPAPLPDDINSWIEGAEHGLVFVCFGSNLQSADLPESKLKILINSFSKLKQRVLWKFESDKLPNLPKNVMVKKWLPQDDILAHPNTKLFISHFGISSYNEALYHKVPTLGIPFIGDQPFNAEKARSEGWAEFVPGQELTQEKLDTLIEQVMTDPKYKAAVTTLSDLYRDRPMSAMKSAIYWIEYIVKHKGADHIKYQGRFLSWWETQSLDIYFTFFVILYIVFKGFKLVLKRLAQCFKPKAVIGGKSKRE